MRNIFATSRRHFSLAKFFQVRYIIKKQTRAKNVLQINKNLNNITLKQGYAEVISLKNLLS